MERNNIVIRTRDKQRPIGDLFGIFLEDINHTADGGLYAEMVQNRSFEFDSIDNPSYHALTAWEKIGEDRDIVLSVMEGDAVSRKNPHYLRMEAFQTAGKAGQKTETKVGVRNMGFGEGMFFERGKRYCFSCYVRCVDGDSSSFDVALQDGGNADIGCEELFVTEKSWEKLTCVFTAKETVQNGSLALLIPQGKIIEFDFVSLFPEETYKGRKNGLRKDLAEALEELHPRFMRFPGGCLVHDGQLDGNARDSLYRWENTIGPVEERPARRNNWRYNQTLGLGYYEYFLLCEDIGAKPVPILPAAYDPHHKRAVPLDELGPWIQETLDLIEFANGDKSDGWGKIRAELGHEKPFGLEYIGIGNEEVGEGFRERFPYFVKAVREKYPEIKIIGSSGPFCGGSEYEKGWHCARENGADLVDEHYYMAPEWFIANLHRYDSFSQDTPSVFLGEYAACFNSGKSALAEAAYMTALQNACGAVKMACYAPLLCHRDYENWKPDLIWFDNRQICKSVNYEVQKLFMNHQGDELISCRLQTDSGRETLISLEQRKQGDIYFCGNEAKVLFTEITLCDEDTGKVTCFCDREAGANKVPVLLAENAPQNFTLKFHAKELEGVKGFRVYFAWKNDRNRMSWVLGGWENQDAALVEEIGGKGCFLTQNQFSVERNREYDLMLRVSGARLEGWMDGSLIQAVELMPIETEPLYFTASRDSATGDIIVKGVNLREIPFETRIELADVEPAEYLCDSYILSEADCREAPDFPGVETADIKRQSKNFMVSDTDKSFHWKFELRSVTVLRLKKRG